MLQQVNAGQGNVTSADVAHGGGAPVEGHQAVDGPGEEERRGDPAGSAAMRGAPASPDAVPSPTLVAPSPANPAGPAVVGSGVGHYGAGAGVASGAGTTGSEAGAGRDSTLAALDALTVALDDIARDQRLLEQKLKDLRRQREEGLAWREILSQEGAPGSMQVVSRMLACLAKASGTLRKDLVNALRREGVSIPAIARMFGVTHQRVSNLLRRPPD